MKDSVSTHARGSEDLVHDGSDLHSLRREVSALDGPADMHELERCIKAAGALWPSGDRRWSLLVLALQDGLDAIGAALTLVEAELPGWGRQVGHPLERDSDTNNGWYASVFREANRGETGFMAGHYTHTGDPRMRGFYAPTASVAVLLALLNALIAKDSETPIIRAGEPGAFRWWTQ